MPVRGLHDFLVERQLIQTESLEKLAFKKLGVDAAAWLKQLHLSEPLQVATGGLPFSLKNSVKKSIEQWKAAKMAPVVVFGGVGVKRERAPFSNSFVSRVQKRMQAWDTYAQGNAAAAEELFAGVEQNLPQNFTRSVWETLADLKVQQICAPYLSWGQLAWLADSKQSMLQGVFGGLELLLFGVSSLIISIDFEAKTYQYVDYNVMLQRLGLNPRQFLDVCILAGFDFSSTFPPLTSGRSFSFQAAYETVQAAGNGYAAVVAYTNSTAAANAKQNYLEVYMKARCVVLNHLIFEPTGSVSPLSAEDLPNDLHKIFGYRMQSELYFLISQGVVSSQAVNTLVHGLLVEAPPLVDSYEYRSLLDGLLPIRSKSLALLSSNLHEVIANNPVVTVRWFDQDKDLDMPHASYHGQVKSLVCRLPAELQGEASDSKLDFGVVCKVFASLADAGKAGIDASKATESVKSVGEFHAVVLTQALQLLEYLDGERKPTAFGKALAGFSSAHAQPALLLLELIRLGQVGGTRLSGTGLSTSEPAFDNEKEILLISRCASMLAVKHKGARWTGPVDHDLMGFNCMVKALNRSLRNLVEMECFSLFARKQAKVPVRDYSTVAARLPFVQENSTAAGIVAKSFLRGTAAADLAALFPSVADPTVELKAAFAFWDELIGAVKVLHAAGALAADSLAAFESANTFLTSARASL